MRTKQSKSPKETIEPTLPDPSFSTVSAATAPGEDIPSRISIPLDSSGNILWDRMRQATKEQLKKTLQSSDAAKMFDQPVAAPVEVFDPAWTGNLYDAVGKMEAFFAGKIYGIPADIADRAFAYSQAEKDTLAGPTAKVINKYAATWMIQFKDEIALAFLFVTITAVKLQAAQMMTKLAAPAKPAIVKPISGLPSADDLDKVTAEQEAKDKTTVQ
jgi:hypothetical protein